MTDFAPRWGACWRGRKEQKIWSFSISNARYLTSYAIIQTSLQALQILQTIKRPSTPGNVPNMLVWNIRNIDQFKLRNFAHRKPLHNVKKGYEQLQLCFNNYSDNRVHRRLNKSGTVPNSSYAYHMPPPWASSYVGCVHIDEISFHSSPSTISNFISYSSAA